MNNKILIIGQLPPPYHGSNVMAKVMLSTLKANKYQVHFIDKSFAKSIETIGKPSVKKILRVPVLAIGVLIASLFSRPSMCIYFIAVGKSAFFVDAFLLFLLRLCRLPYILRFGGKGYRELQNEGFIWHFLVSFTLSNALGGIVLGETMKWDVNTFIQDERLIYVPNGIADHPIAPMRTHNSNIQILYLSNLTPAKGPLEVLKAAKIAIQKQQNLHFILAGAGKSQFFTNKIKSFIADNGLDEYVSMPGGVYGEEKEKIFATSDIFVFPSYFGYEVFGTVNVEAMSWSLPVISSNEGAIPEIVQNGVTGFIVDPKNPEEIADKILTLANNPDLRSEMGLKGRENYKSKYTLAAYAINLDNAITFFEGMLKRNNK
jgi:glycosyltransferase involved in cell wall biosynthesis